MLCFSTYRYNGPVILLYDGLDVTMFRLCVEEKLLCFTAKFRVHVVQISSGFDLIP